MKKIFFLLIIAVSAMAAKAQQKTDSALLQRQVKPSVKTTIDKNAVQKTVNPVLIMPPVKQTATATVLLEPIKGTVKDIDGNVYQTLQIGTQVWMIENLKTTHLNDGTAIVDPVQVLASRNYFGMQPGSFPNGGWGADVVEPNNHSQYVLKATNPAYCFYNNLPSNVTNFGNLYNWYAVNSGKLAPAGWHVPTDADWDILLRYTADPNNNNLAYYNTGGNLKAVGGWNSPNTGATNKSGFTAFPGGYRASDNFSGIGDQAYFWSATQKGQSDASAKNFNKSSSGVAVISGNVSLMGCSVRCVKN